MPNTKFQVNWPFGLGEKAQTSRHGDHFGFAIRTILANVDLQVAPIPPNKF